MSSDHLTPEDDDLAFARQRRREVAAKLNQTDGSPPDDPRMLALYLANLDGIERTAMSRKRLDTDKDLGNQAVQAAGLIAEIFRDPRSSKVGLGVRQDIPVLEADIAPTRVLEGELESSNAGDNYEAFTQRNKQPEQVQGARA